MIDAGGVALRVVATLVGWALASGLVVAQAQGQSPDVAMPNPPQFPFENPPLPDQDILGKLLFWDEQLSVDNTVACGTCHIMGAGGSDPRGIKGTNPGPDGLFGFFLTDDDIGGSPGITKQDASGFFVHEGTWFPNPQVTGRKAPSVINAVYFNELMWDGRAGTEFTDPTTGLVEVFELGALESATALFPVGEVEMGGIGRTWQDVCDKLLLVKPMALATNLPTEMQDLIATHGTYSNMMNAVYGTPDVTSKRVIFAIANYMRTLISDESPLDAFLKGETPDLGPFDIGFNLFRNQAFCTACHVLPFTSDGDFHNIGVRPDGEDIGRQAVTGDPFDFARFKTPNVRNAQLRGGLFHNGVGNVTDLVEFYDQHVNKPGFGPNLDAELFNLYMTQSEKIALIDFLEGGVNDPRVAQELFPFSRPTLRSELPSLNTVYGVPSPNGVGQLPGLIAHLPANLGNPSLLMGVEDATPSAPATLAIAFAPDVGDPFPDPRFPIPMNIDVSTLLLTITTTTDGQGVATVKLTIPTNPVLTGMKLYAQWFITDAAALGTGGIYGSEGVEIEIF